MASKLPDVPRIAADPSTLRLKGKVCIITGANSPQGIGRAAALLFAASGARALYICDIRDTHLTSQQDELRRLHPVTEVHTRTFDAASEPAIAEVVDDALARYGRLDVMFANAGYTHAKRISEIDSATFMETMRVNALSAFLAAKHGSRGMMRTSPAGKLKAGGSVIATASVAGLRSNAGPTDYAASKAAVVSIMQTACYQLSGTDVRCNAICPGLIETGMTRGMYERARKRGTEGKIGQVNPMQRGGLSDEVARLALFLASDEASYVNGQAWAVDGGLSAGHPWVPGKLA